ncbi:MAG: beta-L-arabinofuranosidase domain-containing protein [Candidatus Cryptobacteroides sp.]
MKKHLLCLLLLFPVSVFAAAPGNSVVDIRIGGFVGERIDACLDGRVRCQDMEEIVDPFRHKDDTWSWKTEFLGKWMLGAIDLYEYSGDPLLLEKIKYAADELIETQEVDGYIGNYAPDARLSGWDIWGRKYTALSLLSYYRLTGDRKAIEAVSRSVDCLIADLSDRNIDIAATGNYFGMASCSVLEPVVWLYKETGKKEYLDFAEQIAESLERDGRARLVGKALEGIPVSQRSPYPSKWWSYENGQKAYEMMSCYEGLVELGEVTGREDYLLAARKTAESIVREEINIAGSGAAFECWYMGRERQTIPAYHMMETCVTFTWMQFCARLLSKTGESFYADQFEKTMYNALMSSLKGDGTQISKYSPLEGHRFSGEEQCGLHINCCNANGPRGFGLIPKVALTADRGEARVNLYLPFESSFKVGNTAVCVKMTTSYPVEGKAVIEVNPAKSVSFDLSFRVPGFASDTFTVLVNGETQSCLPQKGYVTVSRKWKAGDVVEVKMDIKTRVVYLNNMQAVVRGPLVFARDSRFGDGFVDESAVIQCDGNGCVDAVPSFAENSFCWLDLQVPMVLGANLEDPRESSVRMIHFCDFASAGNDWDKSGRYRVWIPRTLHVMSQPYHKY